MIASHEDLNDDAQAVFLSVPKTGDDTDLLAYSGICAAALISAAGVAAGAYRRKRSKGKNN